jgi:MerR family transcriptional regulator, light-induced transcriptional regulator
MNDSPQHDRTALADRLLQLKPQIAEQVTQVFLERHPEWLSKYGDRARKFGIEDAQFHIDFLRGAVEASSIQAFEDYCEWAAGLLRSRSIASHFLVENLTQIETALSSELSPEEQAVIARIMEAGRGACDREKTRPAQPDSPLALTRKVYQQSILIGARAGSVQIVEEAVQNGAGVFDIYVQVFQESLYEVGRLWAAGKISVSVEHRATAITQFVMAGLYSRALPSRPSAPLRQAIVTGVAGELHQIGANMVADVLETAGWNVQFLGTDAPHTDIVDAVLAQESDLVCVSATMLFNVPNVVRLILDLRAHSPRLRVLIGGSAFRAKPDLWMDIGADGFAPNLNTAIETADRLVSGLA